MTYPSLDDIAAPSGRAVLQDAEIVIRVPVDVLPSVVEGAWAAGGMDLRLKVTDPALFARELVNELNREDEVGTTPIHRVFDAAIMEAFGQGAEGVEKHETQEV